MAFAVIYLLFPMFIGLTPVSSVNNELLENFYNIIIRYQNEANAMNSPYSETPTGLSQFYKHINENGVGLEVITQLYPILDEKEKYASPGSSILEGIDLSRINLTIFHRYEDVKMGNKLPLLFTNQGPPSAILLKKPQQNMVNSLANSSASCGSTVPEEQHACVTSLEAMMDFAIRMLGTNLRPISTPAGKWQLYTVTGAARTITDKVCGCHKKDSLPFAIYGCHYKMNTKVRVVPLVGEDGTILEAINVCHMNTASWDSNYLLFRLMKAKPGTPVCHFLATDDILWITKR